MSGTGLTVWGEWCAVRGFQMCGVRLCGAWWIQACGVDVCGVQVYSVQMFGVWYMACGARVCDASRTGVCCLVSRFEVNRCVVRVVGVFHGKSL